MKKLDVTCPTCKRKFNYYNSEFRPFCSERCRLIDLGQWLTESYSVPAHKLSEEEQQKIEDIINEQEDPENQKKH